MSKFRKVVFAVVFFCATGSAATVWGNDISQFTSFPPFLPRVVSPNILFLLDFSENMVRPAYGICATGDCNNTPVLFDDFSAASEYYGYFDTPYKYKVNAGKFIKDEASGQWRSNWLNWLTMTQFDVLKKVSIGGDISPAPEQANPGNMPLRSRLNAGKVMYKAINRATCAANAPTSAAVANELCDNTVATPPAGVQKEVAQIIPYKWIDLPASGVNYLWRNENIGDANSKNIQLPFPFPYYGNTFTNANISDNGFVQLVNDSTVAGSYYQNYDMPYDDAYDNLLAVWWDDLAMRQKGATEGHERESYIAWFQRGEAPNRSIVITWRNLYPYNVTNNIDLAVTFQMLIFENGNIIFQYQDTVGGTSAYIGSDGIANNTDQARSATIGVENGNGTKAKFFSHNTASVSNGLALFMTPETNVVTITPKGSNTPTEIKLAPPLAHANNTFSVYIEAQKLNGETSATCNGNGKYWYRDDDARKLACYDHNLRGLLQDMRDSEKQGNLGFRLGIMQLNSVDNQGKTDGGKVIKHFNDKDTTGWPSLMNTVRSQTPTGAAPLAEALHMAQGYYREDEAYKLGIGTNSSSWTYHNPASVACSSNGTNYDPYCFQDAARRVECVKSFALLISSGHYSHDFGTNIDGSTNAENASVVPLASAIRDTGTNFTKAEQVAYKGRTTDLRPAGGTNIDGDQFLKIYAVDTYGENTGTGTTVMKRIAMYGGFDDIDGDLVYDSGEPYPYYRPEPGRNLKQQIESAVNDIMKNSASGTSVSVLSTSAGGEGALYQAYFYPAKVEENQTEETRWPGYLRAFFLDRQQQLRDDSGGATPPDAALVPAEDKRVVMGLDTATSQVKLKRYDESANLIDEVGMDSVVSIWEGGTKLAKMTDRSARKIYFWLDTDGDGVVDNGDFNSLSGEARLLGTGQAGDLKNYLRAQDSVIQTILTDIDASGNVISEVVSTENRSAEQEAGEVINYILGNHVNGYRGRCVQFPGAVTEAGVCATGKRTWPLGDIIFSTPTLVSVPGEKYSDIYGDASYRAFVNMYKGRRSVIYVGANDGMLHAFNGGVYYGGDNPDTGTSAEIGWFEANADNAINGWGTAEIGDELWSFVPYDNLPHLSWLACNGTDRDPTVCGSDQYTHVYYVDHRPKVTDARIFSDATNSDNTAIAGQGDSTQHPNGWGTMLIMPMRLGGGAMDLTADFGAGVQTRSFRSAYYAFDITNPEKKPRLLWRFSDSGLGFTTSYPSIIRINNGPVDASGKPTPGNGEWFMVVGSGPANRPGERMNNRDYNHSSSVGDGLGQTGKIFIVNLKTGALARTFTAADNAIMGDPTVIDADMDFSSDVIYIGSAINATAGRVYRINTNNSTDPNTWSFSVLYDPTPPNVTSADPDAPLSGSVPAGTGANTNAPYDMGPIFVGPSASKDILGNLWIFFGSGRLKSTADITNSDQQRFYGIKDRCWKSLTEQTCVDDVGNTSPWAYRFTDLYDAKAIKVTTATGSATQVDAGTANSLCGTDQFCSYQKLLQNARSRKGWYINLLNPNNTPEKASERVIARSSILGGLLLFTTYTPAADICSIFGDSNLYAVYYETGTAYTKPVVPGEQGVFTQGGQTYIADRISLGQGMPTSVGIAVGETISGFVQKSTGEIIRIETQPGLGVRSGAASWRETNSGGKVGVETIYKHIVK